MKKIIKCLFPLIGCSSLVLAGCGDKPIAELNWSWQDGPFEYTSTKHDPDTYHSFDEATNEYFSTVSEFAFAEDGVKHITDSWIKEGQAEGKTLSLSLFTFDKVAHRISVSFKLTFENQQPVDTTVVTWKNLPFQLIYGPKEYSTSWCLIALGFTGEESYEIPQALQDDHNWSVTEQYYSGGKIGEFNEINWENWQDKPLVVKRLSTSYAVSTFFEEVGYSPQH